MLRMPAPQGAVALRGSFYALVGSRVEALQLPGLQSLGLDHLLLGCTHSFGEVHQVGFPFARAVDALADVVADHEHRAQSNKHQGHG